MVPVRKTCRAGSPCAILLVEDDRTLAHTLQYAAKVYEPGCFDVEHVTTLEAALMKTRGITYDLIVLDLNLPDSEGYFTFKTIRKLADGKTPIAVLTAIDDEAVELACLVEGGAVAYEVKPLVNAVRFLRRCRSWILTFRRDQALYCSLLRDKELLERVYDRVLASGANSVEDLTAIAAELFALSEQVRERYIGIGPGIETS